MSEHDLKILIVDDEPLHLKQMEIVIEKFCSKVSMGTCYDTAIELCHEEKYDIIFVDYLLGNKNGADLADEIRQTKLNKEATIIMVTGIDKSKISDIKSEFSLNQILEKPVRINHVRQILSTHFCANQVFEVRNITGKYSEVLIVDDAVLNQGILKVICEKLGYHVCLAASGSEAIEMAKTERFGVILMDINMPGINGIEATKKIRQLGIEQEKIIIAATTAMAPGQIKEECLSAGMNMIVERPINTPKISRILSDAFDLFDKKQASSF